ncbi:MAG: hypothetical protein AB7U98_10320 [Candidatus Nitrosocosmicus sp.]
MDYENLGKDILNLDSTVRFATILDINDEKVLYSEHRSGTTNLLSKEESKESLRLAINAWKTRGKFSSKIGKGRYVLAEYEKIKRITMPLSDNHLLYVTTEVDCDALGLIDRIKKM